jgi:hypothetical protein
VCSHGLAFFSPKSMRGSAFLGLLRKADAILLGRRRSLDFEIYAYEVVELVEGFASIIIM